MTKIIAFAHFKQSGKSTACEYIRQHIYKQKSYTLIPQEFGGMKQEFEGIKYSVKLYSFADKLKEFCVDVLGLTKDQCYGDDTAKNSLTHLRWEDMPGIISNEPLWLYLNKLRISQPIDELLIFHKPGPMNAREVMQYFGTGICRKMYSNVWVDATIRQIEKDNLDFALIADCRFKNEAKALQKSGGRVIGFTRRPFPEDNHQSEIDLIGYPFDELINNVEMDEDTKNQAVLQTIQRWGWV